MKVLPSSDSYCTGFSSDWQLMETAPVIPSASAYRVAKSYLEQGDDRKAIKVLEVNLKRQPFCGIRYVMNVIS